jgi:transglutaminase-like putative cysteine protease
MIADNIPEERIRSWLLATAPDRAPDLVLAATFDRTRQLTQRSRRRRWASMTVRHAPIVFATGVIAAVLVASLGVGSKDAAGPPDATTGGQLGLKKDAARPPDATTGGQLGLKFAGTSQISGQWISRSEVAFSVRFASPEDEPLYWRAAVYDAFDLTAWRQSVSGGYDVEAGEDVLGDTAERVTEADRRAVTFTVTPEEFRATAILSPQSPAQVDTGVRVSYVDDARFVTNIDRRGSDPYTVTALVREHADNASGITANKLRAAGTAYPEAITQRYLRVPDGALGAAAEQLLADILAVTPDPNNPYDVASTMVDYFQSPANFSYDADVRDLACERLSTVECFARFKRGYCQYYATTMAIFLRERGIPARLVAGFLPGTRDAGRFETVRISAAHAWVEVYFPGYGWVEFDPTGGGIAAAEPLPTGAPVP